MTRSYLTPGWLAAYAIGAAAWVGIGAVTGWWVFLLVGASLAGVVAFWRWIVTERYTPRGLR